MKRAVEENREKACMPLEDVLKPGGILGPETCWEGWTQEAGHGVTVKSGNVGSDCCVHINMVSAPLLFSELLLARAHGLSC